MGGIIMKLWQRLFHRCGENLECIEETRFPKDGTTSRGKVWKNYKCTVCGKLYTSCGDKLYRIDFPDAKPIKINVGGFYN